MTYNGIIAKIHDDCEDKIFLFLLDKENNILKDGVNLDDDNIKIYKHLTYDTIVAVEVSLKDGTKEIKVNLDDFIDGKYGKYDIFIHIKDLSPFRLGYKDKNDNIIYKTVEQVILEDEFQSIAKDCIVMAKKEVLKIEKEVNKNV